MDYINRYNLNINVITQTISINLHNNIVTMNIDPTPLTPHRSIPSCSSFSIFTPCLANPLHTSIANTRFSGVPASIDLYAESLITPPSHSSFSCLTNTYRNHDSNSPSFCNTIPMRNSLIEQNINTLLSKIDNSYQRHELYNLLNQFHRTFDTTTHNIAKTTIHHVINTIPHSPPACKPYPQPDKEEPMYQLVQEFLKAGLISESHSPYAAPAILVKKKDNTYRFVVDYRKLNLITIKDCSPLPNMEDTIRKLGQGYNYFSKLDLKSGFYQIPIHNGDKEKTAFVTPFGLYQFNVLPMGLKNSPPTFQKVMLDTLESCRSFSLVYLDDIIVFSKTFNEHLHHLERVLAALQAKALVLNPPKCVIADTTIDYLGHTISRDKITPMQDKIEAILQIKEPRSLAQANKFIGALSWYRKFIPQFATVAAPIHSVTNLTKDRRHKFKWGYAQSKAFQELKQMLVSKPLFLHYPVEDTPIILTTDASGIGIGGVLQQEVNGQIHNLYYHSQLMTPCERKYSVIEREALAIYKCFARMRTMLLGRTIILMTDHCPLCHIMEKTVRNARVDRITHLIQEYNIEKVIHIKGRENCLPDFLSRYSNDPNDDLFDLEYGLASKSNNPPTDTSKSNNLSESSISSSDKNPHLLAAMTLRPRPHQHNPNPKNSIDNNVDTITKHHKDFPNPIRSQHKDTPFTFSRNQFDSNKLKQEQDNDPTIQEIISRLKSSPKTMPFVLDNDILYKLLTSLSSSKEKTKVIYLPSSMIQTLLTACHDDPMTGAHFSFDRIYNKIKNLYWWPMMKFSIRNYINSCVLCKQYNIARHKKHGHLRSISPPEGPFLMIGIDYCGPFKQTPRENQYVLVITDYFTRYVTAIALPNCTANTTAQTLFNEYFCKYGIPAVILSDQGSHFRNQLMQGIQQLIGYNHIYSTAYHPQTNGMVERFNSTFVPQISKLQDSEQNNWDEYLQAVVFAYNTGIHKTTKFSPYELVYGRLPRLPINLRPHQISLSKPIDYLEQLKKTLRIFHQASHRNIILQQEINKTTYDKNRLDPHYKIGDKVLTRIPILRGKLDPRYSPIPKLIVQTLHPIYIVQDEKTHITSQVHVADIRPLLTT